MLGDCYAAAVVEQLSRKELMALDAAALYHDTSMQSNGQQSPSAQSSQHNEPHMNDTSNVELGNAGYMGGNGTK